MYVSTAAGRAFTVRWTPDSVRGAAKSTWMKAFSVPPEFHCPDVSLQSMAYAGSSYEGNHEKLEAVAVAGWAHS